MYHNLTLTIREAADNCGMLKTIKNVNKKQFNENKPWFDADCTKAKVEFNQALKNCKKSNFSIPDLTTYNKNKTCYKNLIKLKKQAFDNNLIHEL